jgi:hypothetical protein
MPSLPSFILFLQSLMVKNITIQRSDNARNRREILPDDVKSLSVLKAKFENSQFFRYMLRVSKMLYRSGIKGIVRIVILAMTPRPKNSLLNRAVTIKKQGRRNSGYSFTSVAVPSAEPAKKRKLLSFKDDNLFSVSFIDCRKYMVRRKKNIPAPSICPEDAISRTGRGCHA